MGGKDWVDLAASLFTIAVAVTALVEFRRSIAERRRELQWRRASTAKDLIDQVRANPLAAAALKMLDWTDNSYLRPDGKPTKPISHADRRRALRVADLLFSDDEMFIRDCFDRLMEDISLIENYIRIGLIDFADVEPFFRYYMQIAAQPGERACLLPFAQHYGYQPFLDFCARFSVGGPNDGAIAGKTPVVLS